MPYIKIPSQDVTNVPRVDYQFESKSVTASGSLVTLWFPLLHATRQSEIFRVYVKGEKQCSSLSWSAGQ